MCAHGHVNFKRIYQNNVSTKCWTTIQMIIVAVVLSHETVTKPPDNYSIQMIIVGVVFSHETVTKPPDNYSLLGNYL